LRPQHFTLPFFSNAHVCPSPPSIVPLPIEIEDVVEVDVDVDVEDVEDVEEVDVEDVEVDVELLIEVEVTVEPLRTFTFALNSPRLKILALV
jgi:hypothetical protein